VDEFTRECLAIDVAKRLTSEDVLERLSDRCVHRGAPEHIRSDNGSEFTATCVRKWLGRVGVRTLFIEPGSPWENGYVASFNGKLRDELLAREAFDTLLEAKVLIERWRQHYSTVRPHGALGYRPPAPEARQPCAVASAVPRQPLRAGTKTVAASPPWILSLDVVLFQGGSSTPLGGWAGTCRKSGPAGF
jgi:transposase InsO family protein